MSEQQTIEPDMASLELATEVVTAYVSNNPMPAADLPSFIKTIHAAIKNIGTSAVAVAPPEPQAPAVSIKKSVTPDFLICLEDGKKFKSLKRHLGTTYNMTPDEYRAKWGLPSDYPMVAPSYSATRSQLAKQIGLGQVQRPAAADAAEPKGRGRPRKEAA